MYNSKGPTGKNFNKGKSFKSKKQAIPNTKVIPFKAPKVKAK